MTGTEHPRSLLPEATLEQAERDRDDLVGATITVTADGSLNVRLTSACDTSTLARICKEHSRGGNGASQASDRSQTSSDAESLPYVVRGRRFSLIGPLPQNGKPTP